ncbi:MAG TPA: hypothetical protein DCX53_08920 [Anaerolineae bacterium]|nr:hypothetical protein [Anaerolineae bacterium]
MVGSGGFVGKTGGIVGKTGGIVGKSGDVVGEPTVVGTDVEGEADVGVEEARGVSVPAGNVAVIVAAVDVFGGM